MFPGNIKVIAKVLDIYVFGVVGYSVRSESGCMLALRYQANYVPGLPKYLRSISPQDICTSEGYKGMFVAHCHDENDSYAKLSLKEENTGLHKAKPMERVSIKYDPKNNLLTYKGILPNQRDK